MHFDFLLLHFLRGFPTLVPLHLAGEVFLQQLPSRFRHFGKFELQWDAQGEAFEQEPATKVVFAVLCSRGEATGQLRSHELAILLPLLRQLLTRQLVAVLDLAVEQSAARFLHPVGPAMQVRQLLQQAAFGDVATAELFDQRERFGFDFRRPGLADQLVKELPLLVRSRLVVGECDPQAQIGASRYGAGLLMDAAQHLVQQLAPRRFLFLLPAGLDDPGDFPPLHFARRIARVSHVFHQLFQLPRRELVRLRQQPGREGQADLGHLVAAGKLRVLQDGPHGIGDG